MDAFDETIALGSVSAAEDSSDHPNVTQVSQLAGSEDGSVVREDFFWWSHLSKDASQMRANFLR